jgi:hypothetical protein
MATKPSTTIPLSKFTADKSDKEGKFILSAETSEIIWNIAACTPCAFIVKSDKTGVEYAFLLDSKVTNDTGDVAYWRFRPTEAGCPVIKIVIFND